MRVITIGALLAAMTATPAAAQSNHYRDWKVELVDADAVAAYTMNDSGGMFGKICYVSTQNCIWVITSSAPCETDGSYATLSNSNAGAYMHTLTCLPNRQLGQQLMTFNDYDSAVKIAEQAGQVGFAFPIVDGQFRVFRFSLTGSSAAIEQVHELVRAAGKSGTRDLSL